MSTLDLIRTLRRALAELRDAPDAGAVSVVARSLMSELDASLAGSSFSRSQDAATAASDTAGSEIEQLREIGMAVYA